MLAAEQHPSSGRSRTVLSHRPHAAQYHSIALHPMQTESAAAYTAQPALLDCITNVCTRPAMFLPRHPAEANTGVFLIQK